MTEDLFENDMLPGMDSTMGYFADLLDSPKVHCITNDVALTLTANALLAVGAIPTMTSDPFEVRSFTESADSLSINLGMLNNEKRQAIRTAVESAVKKDIPWVLDTTLIERSRPRIEFCTELLAFKPDVVRGNEGEVDVLCKHLNLTPLEFSTKHAILVSTGEKDNIYHEGKQYQSEKEEIDWIDQVAGLGCVLSAIFAAVLTSDDAPLNVLSDTIYYYTAAAFLAESSAEGPGTYSIAFIDALSYI